jgi:hypothetical protein
MMASDRLPTGRGVRRVFDEPEPGWTTELSDDLFGFNEEHGSVLDPARRLRWAAHPGWCDDSFPPSDPRSLLTAG